MEAMLAMFILFISPSLGFFYLGFKVIMIVLWDITFSFMSLFVSLLSKNMQKQSHVGAYTAHLKPRVGGS